MSLADYSDVQIKIFQDRYALRDSNGSLVETMPEMAWTRVADGVAAAETMYGNAHKKLGTVQTWRDHFYDLMDNFRYVPGGRIIAAIGSGSDVTAQNCYVIPSPEDSREGIMASLHEWVEIQSKGGGVGINISSLRPRGDLVKGVNGTSSGPVNWAQLFAFVTSDIIIQGGSRRGAAMIMINCDHPDVFEFIHAKEKAGKLEGCNMSVCLSDAFMEQVKVDGDWDLKFGGKVYKTVRAKQIWDEICTAAWKSAEPGIYFMDRANKEANSGYFETLESTNPCGEQPLGPYGACLLGSFNLMAFVKSTGEESPGAYFDFDEFRKYIPYAVRFNDNVVDLSSYPLPQCRDSQQRIRRMGIGVMGLADVLISLGIRYGSSEAVSFTGEVFRTLRDESYMASSKLAAERGSFPEFDAAEYLKRPFIKRLPREVKESITLNGMRNCYLLTQAQTGTTALLADVNSGIEPYFAFKYLRKDRTGEYWVKNKWSDAYDADDRPEFLVTANDVTPSEHVLIQAAAQKYNDSSISKTANAPESHTVDGVKELYMLTYDTGCKSISYYRDKSRDSQVLNREEAPAAEVQVPVMVSPRRRLPTDRQAITHKFRVGDQEGYLTVGAFDDGAPGEVFIRASKQGSTISGLYDTIGMLLSYCFQYGATEAVISKLTGITFEPSGRTANNRIPFATSVVDYTARWIEDNMLGETSVVSHNSGIHGQMCPECGVALVPEDGCMACKSCFYQKCG